MALAVARRGRFTACDVTELVLGIILEGNSLDISTLLDELAENNRRPFVEARALPPQIYTSEAFLQLELERLFRGEWLCVCRADDLPRSGDYITTDFKGLPIFTIRTAQGQICSYSNVCLHRMTQLLTGRGNCRHRIVCPYHGWIYDLGGQLTNAHFMEQTAGFDPKNYRLAQIRAEEWEGWIYVTLNPAIAPIRELLKELHDIIGRYRVAKYETVIHEDYEWETNWKCVIENFMEDYHVPYVHPRTVGQYYVYGEQEIFEARENFSYILSRRKPDSPRGVAPRSNTHVEDLWRRTNVLYTVLPAQLVSLYSDHCWHFAVWPKGTDRVAVRFELAIAPEVLAEVRDRATFVAEWRRTFDTLNLAEDKVITQRARVGAGSILARPGPLSYLERFTYDFGQYLHRKLLAPAASASRNVA